MSDADPDAARALLLAHIAHLRAIAPLSPEARAEAESVPGFGMSNEHAEAVRRAEASAETLLRAPGYREDLAERLRSRGAYAMVAAANMLARVEWKRGADIERASRLHRFLGESSGCRDIVWLMPPSQSPQDFGRVNRHLGALWVWFTNEFARDERTWTTFVELMKRR